MAVSQGITVEQTYESRVLEFAGGTWEFMLN